MVDKGPTFSSFLYGTPMITLDKLTASENYQSWVDSIKLWFIGNGCKDHLYYPKNNYCADKRPQWRKMDVLLCNTL